MATFVQMGATRDGLDPYLSAARKRGMKTVLIETPDYILLRESLDRQEFDWSIKVEHPAHASDVLVALKQLPEAPVMLLAGFERYIYSAYEVAKVLHIPPCSEEDTFSPPNKAVQRLLITNKRNSLKQPNYIILHDTHVTERDMNVLSYPVVVKPVDGGGGLGVFLAHNFSEVEVALSKLSNTTNYDGEAFSGTLIEEFIPGVEYSVQAVAYNGVSHILTLCKKFIITEPIKAEQPVSGFRETGHIAVSGDEADDKTRQFVQACVDTFGYRNGPFHIDMVLSSEEYYFIEAGFRLSGNGVVQLVKYVSGHNWAEEVLDIYTGTPFTEPTSPSKHLYVGQLTIASEKELETIHQLQDQGYSIEIQQFSSPAVSAIAPSLVSDLSRHIGSLGRVTVRASTMREVEYLLHQCSPERAITHKSV